ncbi:hypothetical protein BgiMline_031734 [Biomphalaria glabrata]|nr:hypothetical protein BgiMline_019944 [Biomphalaria glabrata]
MDQTRNGVILIFSAAFLLFLGADGQSIKITNLQSDTFCSEGLLASNNILLIEGEADLNGDARLSRYIMIDQYFSSDSTKALSVCAMETKTPIDNPSCSYTTTEKDNIYRFFVKLPATPTLSQGKISAYLLYKNATKIAAEINLPGIYNPDSTNVNLKINDKTANDKEIITLDSDVIKLEAACNGSLKPCKLQLEFNDTASKVENQSLLKYEKRHQAQSAVLVTLTVTVCHEDVYKKKYTCEILLGMPGSDNGSDDYIKIIIPVICGIILTLAIIILVAFFYKKKTRKCGSNKEDLEKDEKDNLTENDPSNVQIRVASMTKKQPGQHESLFHCEGKVTAGIQTYENSVNEPLRSEKQPKAFAKKKKQVEKYESKNQEESVPMISSNSEKQTDQDEKDNLTENDLSNIKIQVASMTKTVQSGSLEDCLGKVSAGIQTFENKMAPLSSPEPLDDPSFPVNSEAREYADFDNQFNNDKNDESDSGGSMESYDEEKETTFCDANSRVLDLIDDGNDSSKGHADEFSECLRELPNGEAPPVGYSENAVKDYLKEPDSPLHDCLTEMQYSSDSLKEIAETKELNHKVIQQTTKDTDVHKLLPTATNSEDTGCIEV